MTHGFGIIKVNLQYLGQGKITLTILWRANFAFNGVTCAQTKLAHHVRRHVNIVRTRQIIGLGRTQKTKTVRQNLNRAKTHDLLAILSQLFQDREHQILLTQGRRALNPELFSHGYKVGGIFAFQLFQMHR